MTRQQERLQRDFFRRCDRNVANLAAIFDSLPNIGFYIKDADGRIIAINHYNCEQCNIPDVDFAIGKRSSDLHPQTFAEFCMARDDAVRKSGKPIVSQRYTKVANLSVGARILSLYPLYARNGEIIGTLCCYHCDKPDSAGPVWEERVDSILAKIKDSLSKPIPLAKLAEEHGMSVSHLQRLFLKTIGVRPGRYIIQQRLNAACRLLEETNDGVYNIALATGFCDQSHFTKMFKRERGITPGEYRRKHRAAAHA